MTYLAVCLICAVAVELFIRLPFLQHAARLGRIGRKAPQVISSPHISDHWKEKALQRYSRDMAVCSLLLGFYLAVVLGVIAGLALAFDAVAQPAVPTLDYLMTLEGILVATGFAFVYIFARNRIVA